MTNLEKRKQEEQRLKEQNPELRDKVEMAKFQERRKQKNMRSTMAVLLVSMALMMFIMTLAMKDGRAYFRNGIPMIYWLACLLALALIVVMTLGMRHITARQKEQERNTVELLTEETMIREGWKSPLVSLAAYAVWLLLLVLWLNRNRMPEPMASLATPFIFPILILVLVISVTVPLGAAIKAAKLARAIQKGDYQITAELLCDKEHIVKRGGQDENDDHEYYLFFRPANGGPVKREQVLSRDYDATEIGQVYYRFRRGNRVLKTLPQRLYRLDAVIGSHLKGKQHWEEEPAGVESEEIRRQVDQLRVGDAPEKPMEPVPPDMSAQEEQQMRDHAAVWLRKYDRARAALLACGLLNLLMIVTARIVRHVSPRTHLMGSYGLLLMLAAAMALVFVEIALMMKLSGHLQKAKDAFPYENEEYLRRASRLGRTFLMGMGCFFLFFGVIFSMII